MSICHLNVYGNLASKLECYDFTCKFQKYDIVFFSETWTNSKCKLSLEGFDKPICKHRLRKKHARRDSGGICIYLKSNISKGITVVDWLNYEDGIILKLDNVFFGLVQDIYLVCAYIRPANSSRNITNTNQEQYEMLIDKTAELITKGDVMIVGDLNSRTADLVDYEHNETNLPLINNNTHDTYTDNSAIQEEDLIDNDMSLDRVNEDKVANEYGHMLIRLCKMADMILLNGRCKEDKGRGKVTFCEKKRNKIVQSTVDYVLCTKNILSYISNFKIHDPNIFSDHVIVNVELKCAIQTESNSVLNSHNINLSKVKWNGKKNIDFINTINSSEMVQSLDSIFNKLDGECDELCINECIDDICDFFTKAGKSHVTQINTNKQISSKPCPWYDDECKEKKILFDYHEKQFRTSGSDEDKKNMCRIRNEYRKCCRNKKKTHEVQKAQELYKTSKSNATEFWKKIKRKGHNIGNCDFF